MLCARLRFGGTVLKRAPGLKEAEGAASTGLAIVKKTTKFREAGWSAGRALS